MAELIDALQKEVAAVKLADFEMGVEPPMSPAISESFGSSLMEFSCFISITHSWHSLPTKDAYDDMIWFPRRISELDQAQRVLLYGAELDADHPVRSMIILFSVLFDRKLIRVYLNDDPGL